MDIFISPADRELLLSEFNTLFVKAITPSLIIKGNIACGPNHLALWRQVLDKVYPTPSYWTHPHTNILEHKDSTQPIIAQNVIEYWKSIQLNHPEPESFKKIIFDEHYDDFQQQILTPVLQRVNQATGNNHLIYRVYSMYTFPSSESLSTNVHYDVHTPLHIPYAMLYLTEHSDDSGSTSVYSFHDSEYISSKHGYISSPVQYRAQNLLEASNVFEDHSILDIKPLFDFLEAGSLITFYPSRQLHKGNFPSIATRQVLHFSFLPIPQNLTFDDALRLSRQCISAVDADDSSAPKLVLPNLSASNNNISSDSNIESSVFLFDGTIQCTTHALYLISLVHSSIPNLSNGFLESLVGTLYLEFYKRLGAHYASQDMLTHLSELENYMVSLNQESTRYTLKPPKYTFWPNPEHPKYPQNIHEVKPYYQKSPLFDLLTPIASAGSCFAIEISDRLQKQSYNYIITEHPADPNLCGVYIDGHDYTSASPIYRFSASYGIHFNTGSLVYMANRAFGLKSYKRILTKMSGQYFAGQDYMLCDPYRENVYFRSVADYDVDYPLHTLALKKLLEQSSVFIFTLGLNECWQMRDDLSTISRNPRDGSLMSLLKYKTFTVEENTLNILHFIDTVTLHNPNISFIFSLSPVAFLASGSSNSHVVEANTLSKSVLRVAAQNVCDMRPNAYYFPSYEYVKECMIDPWKPDGRHVKPDTADNVVALFKEMYAINS